jgi:hypothetical protein
VIKMDTADFVWLSLLQRRAALARRSALAAPTPNIAKELAELAALYEGFACRAEAEAEHQVKAIGQVLPSDGKSDPVRDLMSRSNKLLEQAKNVSDPRRADELKYLAGVYGAEAARLKTDRIAHQLHWPPFRWA